MRLLVLALVGGCAGEVSDWPSPEDPQPALAAMAKHECNRCHDGTGFAPAPHIQHCVHCHQEVKAGAFVAAPDDLARWQGDLHSLLEVPSLASSWRLRRAWIEAFLLRPTDVRPHLDATMPRLALTPDEARAIAAFLSPLDRDEAALGDPARGEALYATRGCAACHATAALAPDLAHVNERMTPAAIVDWILAPAPESAMPPTGVTEAEARDLAAYLVGLRPEVGPTSEEETRLPLLERPVSYDEVARRVFLKTCWHCHGATHYAFGDGGPGNTGGFGFAPRGLDLSSYGGVSSGSFGPDGRRRSVFPFLVEQLWARRVEERGGEVPGVRGMPLGLPALSREDIQIVESWIAQGRPE